MSIQQITSRLKAAFFSFWKRFFLGRRLRGVLQFVHGVEVRHGAGLTGLKKVLVLAPHPDDESIGCGGTLLSLTRAGVDCEAVFMTCGELSYIPAQGETFDLATAVATKKRHAAEAAAILGLKSLHFLEALDGELHESPEKISDLAHLIKRGNYQRIFCPWAHDAHPDHFVTFRMLQLALRRVRLDVEIWLYEVWSPLITNRIVSIDETIDQKIEAISVYQDAHERVDYASRFLGLAKYRSLLAKSGSYAEAFLVLDKRQFQSFDFPGPSFVSAPQRQPRKRRRLAATPVPARPVF